MNRNALLGAIAWLSLMIATRFHEADLGWVDLLFLFAPLVIVPLGLELTSRLEQGLVQPAPERIARLFPLPCALAAAASFFFQRGLVAASLAAVWLVFCTLLALGGASRLHRGALRSLDSVFPVVAFLYLPIGGAWLVAARLGLKPMNFQEPIVLLTAVHFHYAGFAAPLLARCPRIALPRSRMRARDAAFLNGIVTGVLVGPGMLAAGFVIGPRVKLAAAIVLALGEVGLALFFLFALGHAGDLGAKLFIAVAAGSVFFSMALAALWAVGEYPLQPFVHLAEMARLHGTANAFGFALCGLLGWARAAGTGARAGEE